MDIKMIGKPCFILGHDGKERLNSIDNITELKDYAENQLTVQVVISNLHISEKILIEKEKDIPKPLIDYYSELMRPKLKSCKLILYEYYNGLSSVVQGSYSNLYNFFNIEYYTIQYLAQVLKVGHPSLYKQLCGDVDVKMDPSEGQIVGDTLAKQLKDWMYKEVLIETKE